MRAGLVRKECEILKKLAGGDRRSIGKVAEVVADVRGDPSLFAALFEGMSNEDLLVRMRAADALEKVTARRPEYLHPYKGRLLRLAADAHQQEVRWHLAQVLPRLDLDDRERAAAFSVMLRYLNDESRIVRTFAMQALAELAEQDVNLLPRAVTLIRELTVSGSPAMRSRGRKLLGRLANRPAVEPES